jgi:DNA-binding CsgD family transcriptional regulator
MSRIQEKDLIERWVMHSRLRLGGTTMLLQITPGERLALQWLAQGRRSSDIAKAFSVTEAEMGAQMTTLLAKIGAKTPVEAVAAASTRGLLTE